ncbi:HVA22-like protein e [Apostasia shenzhenica]|uniref:HVA22-like protein n=1 Tax=Apostasia shenzhenica TaxID=1088818 RepID=A0A2H9ZWE2_9ASPA|nr:HVA22-like protein e [Apostasia shenzhenica]
MGQLWTIVTYLYSLAGYSSSLQSLDGFLSQSPRPLSLSTNAFCPNRRPCVMLLYPLYASVEAIESPSKVDDEQWLAYWIIYSFLTLFEMVAEPLLSWIPIWHAAKVVFAAWLVLPQFRGSAFIYNKFVRQQLKGFGWREVRRDTTLSAAGSEAVVSLSANSSSPSKKRNKFFRLATSKKVKFPLPIASQLPANLQYSYNFYKSCIYGRNIKSYS